MWIITLIFTLSLIINQLVMEDTEDLFEHYELLPIEVQYLLGHWAEADNTYENCESLISDLNKLGYTCEYGLDAEPYNLQKI